MPKILTYAAQNEPFIHVDGDVFIWVRFSRELENSDQIMQNFEVDGGYYKVVMDEVREEIKDIPDFLENELNKSSIASYRYMVSKISN